MLALSSADLVKYDPSFKEYDIQRRRPKCQLIVIHIKKKYLQ